MESQLLKCEANLLNKVHNNNYVEIICKKGQNGKSPICSFFVDDTGCDSICHKKLSYTIGIPVSKAII